MTKALSMKKLYELAGGYITSKYTMGQGMPLDEPAMSKANEEIAELHRFLNYVWEHRND